MEPFSMQDLSRDSNSPKAPTIVWLRWEGPLLKWAFCLGLLTLGALARQTLATSAVADPNKPKDTNTQRELSHRLDELIRQLRQERSAYYVQKAQHEARIEKARENRRILQGEVEDLRRQEAETDQQIRQYEAEVKGLKNELLSRESLEDSIRDHIEPFLVSQRAAIGNGIPYKHQERIARFESADDDVNAPSPISARSYFLFVAN